MVLELYLIKNGEGEGDGEGEEEGEGEGDALTTFTIKLIDGIPQTSVY